MSVHTPEELQQIITQIDTIDWSQYHTAYGNASGIETNPKKWWERFLPMSMIMHRHRYFDEDCRDQANIAKWLKILFAEQEMDARKAASKLENALCHQHVMVADAALPAYDILIYCLKTTDSALLTEDLLDILRGFAAGISKIQLQCLLRRFAHCCKLLRL
ncbi:hypothetical protein [uncultured Ruminococcus sp.]|uniref:hypothetical protein n=1 Tax=uncultured Ruminococcus sp. TaxID=165186 RepID=UPI002676B839|nr:hypothetical protein [uncultured Ruminococcus sp.]